MRSKLIPVSTAAQVMLRDGTVATVTVATVVSLATATDNAYIGRLGLWRDGEAVDPQALDNLSLCRVRDLVLQRAVVMRAAWDALA